MEDMQPQDKSAEKKKCGAKLRNKNKYCERAPALGRNRCRLHGGETPRGIASPHYKGGYMSTSLPTRLMARMDAALNDEALHSMNRDIAFVSARIDETLARIVDDHEAETTWQKLLSLRDEFNAAETNEDRGAIVARMFEVMTLAERDMAAFDEVHKLIEQRAGLIKKETDRQIKLSAGVTLDQVSLYFRALTTAVREHVDQQTLTKIYEEFERINSRSARLRITTTQF